MQDAFDLARFLAAQAGTYAEAARRDTPEEDRKGA